MQLELLKSEYKHCEKIIKKNSKSFYKAFSNLPEEKKMAVFGIYAYCRYADDIIDIEKDEEKLNILFDKLKRFEKREKENDIIFKVLFDIFESYDMDIKPFYEMLIGQQKDINFKEIVTLEDLEEYCYYVASSVGLMILPIIAQKNKVLVKSQSIILGKAMQLTNILRDIGEDLDNQRVYIPSEILKEFNIDISDLESKKITNNFIYMWEYLANIAQEYYNAFYKVIKLFDKDSIEAVLSAAIYYNAILDSIRDNNYNCLSKRNYVKNYSSLKTKFNEVLE